MQIIVRTTTIDRLVLQVAPNTSVSEVKTQIYESKGLALHLQRLIFNGSALSNDQTLLNCGVGEGSTLSLEMQRRSDTVEVFVKNLDGSVLVLDVGRDDSVKQVKQSIKGITSIDCKHQRLIFGGIQLEDEFSVRHYGITKGGTIYLMLRLLGGGLRLRNNVV